MADHDENIHIWIIIRLYHPNFSGAAIQGHQIFRKLVRQGFSTTVLTSGEQAASGLRGQGIQLDNVNIRYLPTFQPREWAFLGRAGRVGKVLAYFQGLLVVFSFGILTTWTLLREGRRGDVVHIVAPDQFSFLPIWVARARGMHPIVEMTLLGSDDPQAIRKQRDKFSALLRRQSFNRAEAIIGKSTAQIESCLSTRLDTGKIIRIPCGVEPSRFSPVDSEARARVRKELGLEPYTRCIIFVGSAIARKGIDVLIQAFIQVYQQFGDVALLIVGPCEFKNGVFGNVSEKSRLVKELKDKLEAAGCSSHVHWIGRVDNVHDYMRAADVFCLPTRREGFGTVIVEAMAAGLPVVVARLEGVTTDIVQSDREGILIDGHNPDDYAAALLRLLRDPDLARAMGDAARERAVAEFDLKRIVERYAQLYRELAGVT